MASVRVKKVIAKLLNASEQTARKAMLKVNTNLRDYTPEESNWASSNWVASVGSPVSGVHGTKENVTTAPQAKGMAQIITWKFKQGNLYITNNVPYINDLNAGSSEQAPAGFVQRAIKDGVKQ